MELKHDWIGRIESQEQFYKRNARFARIDTVAGLIVFLAAFLFALLTDGLKTWSMGEMVFFLVLGPVLGFILLTFGLVLFFSRSYFIGLHVFVDREDIDTFIGNGRLRKDIENILSSGGIEFIQRKKRYYPLYYDLPDGLKLGVGGPIEQGRMGKRPIFLIMVQIQKINTENMETARKIQALLDNLDIRDNHMLNEANKQDHSLRAPG